MYKRGWWKVNFEITLDGENVGFDDLSESAKEQILYYVSRGCWQGEVEEEVNEFMTKTDVINMIDCMRDGENKSYERCSINEQRTHDHVVINAVYDHIIDTLNMLFPDE